MVAAGYSRGKKQIAGDSNLLNYVQEIHYISTGNIPSAAKL